MQDHHGRVEPGDQTASREDQRQIQAGRVPRRPQHLVRRPNHLPAGLVGGLRVGVADPHVRQRLVHRPQPGQRALR